MAERIDLPPTLQGDENNQLQQMWSYLYQLSEAINSNLDAIGGNDLTDKERQSMQQILQAAGVKQDGVSTDYETLKSLIIKTADFVQTGLQEYRTVLFGETVAASQFGQYNRRTGMDVAVTPEGVLQKFSLREIVKDLKTYEINAKNYIKTGLLRTENDLPVYGVAIGKDVVTFSENGTETYNDGNKVAELTADELSFWQSGVKVAGYTGNKISFYYNGTEAFYIQNGKLYSTNDIQLSAGKKVIMGKWSIDDGGIVYKEPGDPIGFEIADYNNREENTSGLFYQYYTDSFGRKCGRIINRIFEAIQSGASYIYKGAKTVLNIARNEDDTWTTFFYCEHEGSGTDENYFVLGDTNRPWDWAYIGTIIPKYNHAGGIGSKNERYNDAFLDHIRGGFSWEETTETNINNLTRPGHYYFSNLYSITGKPSDLSNQEGYLEISRTKSSDILSKPYMQKLYANNNVYIRTGKENPATASSWYKFTGTAV